MAAAKIQAKVDGSNSASQAYTLSSPTTSGNFLLVQIAFGTWTYDHTRVVSVTDNAGNTYHPAGDGIHPASDNDWHVCTWYAYNITGHASPQITVTIGDAGLNWRVVISEWNGVWASSDPRESAYGVIDAVGAAPSNWSIGPVTPDTNGALIVLGIYHGWVSLDDAGDTLSIEQGGYFSGLYYLQTTAGPYTANLSFVSPVTVIAHRVVFRTTARWVDIPDWHAHARLDASQYPGGQARCLCDLWTEDTGSPLPTIQARLVSLLADGSVDAVVGTSAVLQAATPTDATFPVTLVGHKAHKLQLTSDTADIDLFCAPGAKVTA